MVNKKRVLVLGVLILFGIFISLSFASAFVSFSNVGGTAGATVVNTVKPYTNWSVYNNTYNSSVIFVNVTFFSAFNGDYAAGPIENITLGGTDNNTVITNDAANIVNATVYVLVDGTWVRAGTITNRISWGDQRKQNMTAIWGNVSINTTLFRDGTYTLNVTISNGTSKLNASIINDNATIINIDNELPVVFLNNVTVTYTYQSASNLSAFRNGIRNYSGTLTINATIINPGTGVGGVVFNITNGTTKTVSYNKTLTREGTTERYSATFDSTILTDGFYNFSIAANSSWVVSEGAPLINNSHAATIGWIYIDNTAPTATLTCTPTSVSSGATETCACAASDATTSITTTYTANPSTANTGTQTTSCVVWDSAGNSYTTTDTYNVEITGGSSSSGSSSTSSSPSRTTTQTLTEDIVAGSSETLSGFDATTGVKEMIVEVSNTASGVSVSVNKYNNVPAEVGVEKEGEVYRYLQIETENLESLTKATVEIQVSKSWVASKELAKEDIAMYKFKDGAWNELTTTFKSEDSNNYYYTIELTSFSYFAIGERAEQAVVANEPVAEASGNGLMWVGIIAGIIIVAGLIYWMAKKK